MITKVIIYRAARLEVVDLPGGLCHINNFTFRRKKSREQPIAAPILRHQQADFLSGAPLLRGSLHTLTVQPQLRRLRQFAH